MMRLRLLIVALCATLLLFSGNQLPGQDTIPADDGPQPDIRILGLEDRPRLREEVRLMARRSRQAIREQTALEWDRQVIIVWTNEQQYLEQTGFRPEHTAAAASPLHGTVWINESAWMRSNPRNNQQTLTHELGHVLLGTLPGGRKIPLWTNEGIVMHLAGQYDWDENLRLMMSRAFGQLPNLADLEEEFPRQHGAQGLAYRMSYAATSTLAQEVGDDPGSVRRLLHILADPVEGPRLAEELWDPVRRDTIEAATARALGSRLTTSVIVLTSTGTIFLLMAVLIVAAYLIVRKRRAEQNRQYEAEREAWEESLTDDDIQDIYGDREERWDADEDERLYWEED